jgi:hypothetical protein
VEVEDIMTQLTERVVGINKEGNTMDAIAFQSEVKDGVICIPEQYRDVFSSPVLVTIVRDLRETKEQPSGRRNIEWLNHPWKMDSFVPLTRDEIYDRT